MDRFKSILPWFLAVLVAIIAGAAFTGLPGAIRLSTLRPWSFTQSITDNDSVYYRLKVKLSYKDESQDFDIVVACHVRQIFYGDGGRTYEAGLTPTVFGRRMRDGKALVVRPPRACGGETTANGRVQPDLLPLVIVYDDADRLDFGVAYLSEDAYENPFSVLKFGGATIEKATRAQFNQFRRKQVNVVSRELYHSTTGAYRELKLTKVDGRFAWACVAYGRFRVPEEARATVRGYWPDGHPRYWQPDTYEVEHKLEEAVMPRQYTYPNTYKIETDRPGDVPHSTLGYFPNSDEPVDFGLKTRTGGGLVSKSRGGAARSYYPAADDYRLDLWPRDHGKWSSYVVERSEFADINIDFEDGQTRGFGYCFASGGGATDPEHQAMLRRKKIVGHVDGEVISSKRAPWGPAVMPARIYERDEYVFAFVRVYLGSPRGDL
jgi:hypothetical protein